MLRNLRTLVLVCAPILIVGCASPNRPSMLAGPKVSFVMTPQSSAPVVADTEKHDSDAPAVASPKPQDAKIVAASQPQQDSLTGQLADGFLAVFKTFTGR
ncbi:MAG TPA: hypothetical protein VGO67_20400 [Verrucomicrobiae bacterium]|jgi:hypothetical protein